MMGLQYEIKMYSCLFLLYKYFIVLLYKYFYLSKLNYSIKFFKFIYLFLPPGLSVVTRIYEGREEWARLFDTSDFFHKYKSVEGFSLSLKVGERIA